MVCLYFYNARNGFQKRQVKVLIRFCVRCYRCWYRYCIRLPNYRLRQESVAQTAAFLLRHLGFRPFRGHGALLFDDGLFVTIRFLNRFFFLKKYYINQ